MLEHQKGLPDWFFRDSPLSMDAVKGPDAQYCAGARDMLHCVEKRWPIRAQKQPEEKQPEEIEKLRKELTKVQNLNKNLERWYKQSTDDLHYAEREVRELKRTPKHEDGSPTYESVDEYRSIFGFTKDTYAPVGKARGIIQALNSANEELDRLGVPRDDPNDYDAGEYTIFGRVQLLGERYKTLCDAANAAGPERGELQNKLYDAEREVRELKEQLKTTKIIIASARADANQAVRMANRALETLR